MVRKFIAAVLMIAMVSLIFAGCVGAPDPVEVEKPRSVAEIVAEQEALANAPAVDFELAKDEIADICIGLSKVKRSSGDEAEISAYLVSWAEKEGLTVTSDEFGNVIVDRKAAAGFEDAEKVILQSHMDCVYYGKAVASAADLAVLNNANGVLSAEGMSFGADSAIGMAMIMYIMQTDEWECGPLRAIFTVDGDNTLNGAKNIDPAVFDSSKLISFNGVGSDTIGYGHTGSSKFTFTKQPAFEENKKDTCYRLAVTGLVGGDSGLYADSGNANALRVLAQCLDHIKISGIDFTISELEGGGSEQVIPTGAAVLIVLDSAQATDLEVACASYKETFDSVYAEVEPGAVVSYAKMEDVPKQTLSQSDTAGIISLLTLSVEGVNTMSSQVEGLVESSSCINYASANAGGIVVNKFVRGYSQGRFDQMANADMTLASMCGFALELSSSVAGWTNASDSALLTKAVAVYGGIIGDEVKIDMLNTNMELGVFAEKKAGLDMIIVGCDISGLHSTAESCDMSDMGTVIEFVYTLLREI